MDADDKHDTQPGNTEQHDEEVAHGATHFAAGKDNLNIAESAEKSCKCLVGGWRIDLDKAEGFGKIPKPPIVAVIVLLLDLKLERQHEHRLAVVHAVHKFGVAECLSHLGGHRFDDGTLAPPAVAGSLPFAPEIAVPTLNNMYQRYGELVYGRYGFYDAFNPSFQFTEVKLDFGKVVPDTGWFGTDYIAIDQGPILAGLENYRTGGVWSKLRQSSWVRKGLIAAGFRGGWIEG